MFSLLALRPFTARPCGALIQYQVLRTSQVSLRVSVEWRMWPPLRLVFQRLSLAQPLLLIRLSYPWLLNAVSAVLLGLCRKMKRLQGLRRNCESEGMAHGG